MTTNRLALIVIVSFMTGSVSTMILMNNDIDNLREDFDMWRTYQLVKLGTNSCTYDIRADEFTSCYNPAWQNPNSTDVSELNDIFNKLRGKK